MTWIDFRSEGLSYGTSQILKPFSLRLAIGERVALVGGSGAGKSSLLNCLYPQAGADAVLLPQDLGLVASLSAYHNVYMGQLAAHASWYNLLNLLRPWPARVAEVQPLLAGLGLADKAKQPVDCLSGGQCQRVAVARSLYQQGRVLLADEPVSALDLVWRERVMTQLTQAYPTALIALHDVSLALRFCQRVIGLQGGEVVLDAPSKGLSESDLQPLYREG